MPHAPQIDFTERDTHRFFEDIKTLIKRKIISDDFTDYYGNFFDEISSMGRLANDMPGHLLRHGRYFLTQDYYNYNYSGCASSEKRNYVEAPPIEARFSEHAEYQSCFFVSMCVALLNPHLKLYVGFAESRYFHMWLFDEEQNTIIEPTPISRDYYYGIEINDIAGFVESGFCGLFEAAKINTEEFQSEDDEVRNAVSRLGKLSVAALAAYEATKAK